MNNEEACNFLRQVLASQNRNSRIGGRNTHFQNRYLLQNNPVSEIKQEPQKSTPSLADDLISLYREETLCDVKLRAKSETFSVHKAVLSARSPVFKKMFTSDMREKSSECVDIPDIKADTLSRLLMFIYKDEVDDMNWENGLELYFAADKYQIDSLKFKCVSFFKSKIEPSNACDLLLLADMHQDDNLKQFVQEYIVKRDKEVFGTEKWKTFIGNHAQLAAETMHLKYTRM